MGCVEIGGASLASMKRPAPPSGPPPAHLLRVAAFTPGQHVTILAPPLLAGEAGVIVGPIGQDGFTVRLQYGNEFEFSAQDLHVPRVVPPRRAMAKAMPRAELLTDADANVATFATGQRVTIIAPSSPLLGNQGTILGPIGGLDGFKVRMLNGMIAAIASQNLQLQDAGASASAPSPEPEATETESIASSKTAMPVPTDVSTP